MRTILVTGGNGFIARNLIKILEEDTSLRVLKFLRENDLDDLFKSVAKADFIFHLAGEVRPKSAKSEFENSNSGLTKALIDALVKGQKKIPILLASTIHSDISNNYYGRTKKESELMIQQYSSEQGIPCYIFKLPHVFGEGCKANHNSIVTTWIYNSIHDLSIEVYDRNHIMNYVYVQDLANDFVDCMYSKAINPYDIYKSCSITFTTNLGEVIDYIYEFRRNIESAHYKIAGNEFKEKLFHVFKGYYYS
jgi:UDP-2-acetamido-2,6-beta-L-arabino-hexul-4-ose reductase